MRQPHRLWSGPENRVGTDKGDNLTANLYQDNLESLSNFLRFNRTHIKYPYSLLSQWTRTALHLRLLHTVQHRAIKYWSGTHTATAHQAFSQCQATNCSMCHAPNWSLTWLKWISGVAAIWAILTFKRCKFIYFTEHYSTSKALFNRYWLSPTS